MTVDRYKALEAALQFIRSDPRAPDGWSAFYRWMAPQIRGQLFLLGVRDPAQVEDLTHDVLMRFLQYCPWRLRWHELPPAAGVVAYLRRVVRSVFFDDKTRIESLRMRWPANPGGSATEFDDSEVQETAGSVDDLWRRLGELARQLTPSERELLRLVVDGATVQQIADSIGISYTAAGVRIHRLRQRLKTLD
jgi:RNA polymerase sigma factor (sigma-70 family)